MKGVFIHIPKNAGSSINSILPDDCLNFRHHPACYVKEILDDYSKRFSFAFVRNPWDRLVSLYEFKKSRNRVRGREDPIHQLVDAENFSGFVREILQQDFISPMHGHNAAWQQKEWVTEGEKIIVDFIGKVETIEQDMAYVKRILDIDVPLPRLNTTDRSSYVDYYDAETRDLVGARYIDDIEMFKYEFGI